MRPRRAPLPLLLALVVPLSGCGDAASESTGRAEEPLIVCPAGSTLEGVDISHYNDTIDWAQVAASGRVFAYAKATEGTSSTDATFATNWAGMKAHGLLRGAYHFFRPAVDSVAQANLFVSTVGMLGPGDLPAVLDVEAAGGKSAAQIVAAIQTWMTIVEAGTGRTPLIYTARYFWDGSVGSSTAYAHIGLWDAQWGVTCPNIPEAWATWSLWQYSATGTVPGIPGDVDLDRFNGTLVELQALAGIEPDAGILIVTDGGATNGGDAATHSPDGSGAPGIEPVDAAIADGADGGAGGATSLADPGGPSGCSSAPSSSKRARPPSPVSSVPSVAGVAGVLSLALLSSVRRAKRRERSEA